LGIIPGYAVTKKLVHIVRAGNPEELIYTAPNINADEAYRSGLVNTAYNPEFHTVHLPHECFLRIYQLYSGMAGPA